MSDIQTYRLDQFEGPLDLLLDLIKKNKVSITRKMYIAKLALRCVLFLCLACLYIFRKEESDSETAKFVFFRRWENFYPDHIPQ